MYCALQRKQGAQQCLFLSCDDGRPTEKHFFVNHSYVVTASHIANNVGHALLYTVSGDDLWSRGMDNVVWCDKAWQWPSIEMNDWNSDTAESQWNTYKRRDQIENDAMMMCTSCVKKTMLKISFQKFIFKPFLSFARVNKSFASLISSPLPTVTPLKLTFKISF